MVMTLLVQKERKSSQHIRVGNETLFTGDMIMYVINTKDSTNDLREFSRCLDRKKL